MEFCRARVAYDMRHSVLWEAIVVRRAQPPTVILCVIEEIGMMIPAVYLQCPHS